MDIPNTYTDKNETGCCPVPNVDEWDKKVIEFSDRNFIRMYTRSFLFMPLNMGKIITELYNKAQGAGAMLPVSQSMILSRDLSPWRAEQLYATARPVEGADNVVMNGKFAALVFDGPYREAGKWYKEMMDYAKELGYETKEIYFFYATCPKCAVHYDKNYVIGLAKIS